MPPPSYRERMGWFRRRRPEPEAGGPGGEENDRLPVPLATAPALARTERALQMLAAQSSQLHGSIVALEHRVDALADTVLDQMDRPSYEDVLATRLHSAKVAAELARLEVNVAARLDAVRNDIRVLSGDPAPEIDLRELTPSDTGW